MEVVFIDPEPPDAAGGGIRTYLILAIGICLEAGHGARVYTHNPQAYPHGSAFPIGRKPWLRRPFRGLAYRWLYRENVLWEQAYWLSGELRSGDRPDRVYEFADFLGYGFFALRNRPLRERILVRIHTPDFLVRSGPPAKAIDRLAAKLGSWRERDALRRARRITAPSAEFMREKLPWLTGWEHIPNPLPGDCHDSLAEVTALIRVTENPPPAHPSRLPQDDSDWKAADPDPAEIAERNAPRPTRIRPHRFLYLGRIEERKGVSVLVRAFIRLAQEQPYATLTLVGSASPGAYSESVRNLIESLPAPLHFRIRWEPPCPAEARAALFRRFSVLVAPSLWENSPYVYFEGMAAGLACIGSATGEMKAVAAITGALSPRPGDEDSWLDALRAHCSGADGKALTAQAAYLRERGKSIPPLLLDAWMRAAVPA